MFCILCIISFFPPAELQISFLLVHHHGSKMLRSESNSSITQSPIGWQISHLLSLLHEPTSGMCVCTSECVLPVLVCSSGLSGHHEWHSHKPALTRLRPVFHACSSFCVSHITCCYFVQRLYSRKWAFSLPERGRSSSEPSFFCSLIRLHEKIIWHPHGELLTYLEELYYI